jgi:predicted unusual protein kinase regulating ubiquinone biosynthesis (AarF/ABC1/UbiB family)
MEEQVTFTGPFTVGPPQEALAVRAPALARAGWPELVRTLQIAAVLLATVLRALAGHVARGPADLFRIRRDRSVRRSYGDAVSQGLVEGFMTLGPTFVKLGQAMASSPGVFPRPLADACLRTLDDVPPFPTEIAQRIVEEDLGASIEAAFRSFDPAPLSAASIAQVHACVLEDGRHAVLKIQRPDIRDIMNRDLRIMYRVARMIDRTRTGHLMNAPGIIEDLHQVTNEELNFALEAHRQDQFRTNIGAFGDNHQITAPEVYWDHCGLRVICMERMYGTPLDRVIELDERGIDGELVLRRGVKVWIEAALVHGPFHGDVHAGNLWLLDDGRAAFLDFGIMGVLPDLHREAVRDAEYTVMIDGDYTRIVRSWQRIGILAADSGPVEDMAARLALVLEPMFDMKIHEVSIGTIMKQQLDLQQEYGARAARELVLVTKQLVYFERYAKALAPNYNMARDLWLLKNVFPEATAVKAAERGITFPE